MRVGIVQERSVISIELALRLRDAGLAWAPGSGDRFVIPDRNLDDQVFTISEMTVDVRSGPAGRFLAFNGTVEWALDAILQDEVVWLPDETALREALGDHFVRLERVGGRFRCEVDDGDRRRGFDDADAAVAYGLALLAHLERRALAR